MTSTPKDSLNNVNIQEYDGVLNIDVFNQGINDTLPNNISCCGDEPIKSIASSNRIKLEYFNIDRNDKSVLESGGKCKTLFKNTNLKLYSMNKNDKGINKTEQYPNKSEIIGLTELTKIDQSQHCQSKYMSSRKNKARDRTVSVDVESKHLDSTETERKSMENRKISGNKYTDSQVVKSKYIQMIENHAYINKFDREKKGNCSKDVHFDKIINQDEREQKSYKRNFSSHGMDNPKTNFKSTQDRLKIPTESASDKTVRGKSFHTRKLPKNIRFLNDEKSNIKGHGNCLQFPKYSQVMECVDKKQSEQKKFNDQNNSNQIKHHMIINSSISSSNTSITGSKVSKNLKSSQNEGSTGLELEKSQMAGKRGEGDNNLAPDPLCVKILLPLEKSIYRPAKPRSIKSSRSFKLFQNQLLKEKLENPPRNQQSVEGQQLYYNFLLPENNFIEKYFGGNSQEATPQIIQPPIIENEQSRNTNTCSRKNSPQTNEALSPESTTRVEFMSVQKRKNRNRNSKSKSSQKSELEKRKIYPGNIVKMREDETPCEYLNQFSSILIDNLKDPIPKDPLNLPHACNVYVPKRKHPIPLERYAEHYISTTTGIATGSSKVTVTTSTLSETSDSNSQSVSTSKSIIILKKISELTKISDDKDKNVKCSNEKQMNKRKNIKHLHRQSDQSFVEKPCCCFIQ